MLGKLSVPVPRPRSLPQVATGVVAPFSKAARRRTARKDPLDRAGAIALTGLGAVYAFAVAHYGGASAADWNLCLLGLGVLALVYWVGAAGPDRAPAMEGWLRWALMLLPAYVLFQMLPLPASWIELMAPHRGEIHRALAGIAPEAGLATISVLPSATMVHLLRIAAYTVFFLLVREIAWRMPERPWAVTIPILAVAGGEALLGVFQYVMGGAERPATGTYVNHNHFSGLLEMSIPFALMYAIALVRGMRRGRRTLAGPALKACAAFALTALVLAGIIFSHSRAGFVTVLALLLAIGVLGVRRALSTRAKLLAAAGVTVVVAGAFVFLPSNAFIARYARIASVEAFVAEGRVPLWTETLDLIRHYPLFGCGLGAYGTAFLEYKTSWPLVRDDYAHNDYLQLLAELGVAGFAIGVGLVLALLVKTLRVLERDPRFERRCLALACVGSIAAIAVHSVADFNLYLPANAMLLAWVLGIASALEFTREPSSLGERIGLSQVIDVTPSAAGAS